MPVVSHAHRSRLVFLGFEEYAYHTVVVVLGTAVLAGVLRLAVVTLSTETIAEVGEAVRGEQQRSEENKLHVWFVRGKALVVCCDCVWNSV